MAIEKLPSVGTITTADSIPISSAQLGADARISLGTLLQWIQSNIQSGTTPTAVSIVGTPVLTGVAGSAYAGFTVSASGGTPPYTYSLNSVAIGAGLTINATTGLVGGATLGAAATYAASVTATDVLGSTAMLPFSLTISAAPVTAPTITTQPNPQSVTPPATATFSVVAAGGGTLVYQWQKNGGNIAGATAASYTTPATTSGDNGSSFTCVVSNSAGSVTSSAAVLTVAASVVLPTITTQPASSTVQAPATANFSVTATNGGGTLSYQWRRTGAAIAGATGSSYTTAATATSDSGSTFDVVVTNSAGSVTSTAATLTVTPPAPDTRPGWFAAPSTAATTGTAGFISGRTVLSNSTNGGKTGTANPVTTTGSNFCWFAVANSGTPTFRDDASGFTGGFTLTGSPFTDANGTVWYLYKSDYAASYSSASITLI